MHRLSAVLLGLIACSLSLLGQPEQPLPSLPPRGTVLMAKQEGKLWQLVDVKGRRGVVRLGTQEMTLPKEQSYLPMRNDDVAPGYIDVIKDESVTTYFDEPGQSDSVASRSKVYVTGNQFEAYVQSKTAIEDCCIALFFVNTNYLKGADPELHCTMVLNRVGDLAPGKRKLIRITMTDIKANAFNSAYYVLFLSKGREVKSSYSGLTDRCMAMIEARQHVLSVERYIEQNKGQDKPVAVYSQERVRLPQLPAGVSIPDSVEAAFTVDSEGNVGGLEIAQASLPTEVYQILYASVRTWRFLPQLERGRAVPCVVRIPISLKG